MKKKQTGSSLLVSHRRASHDYFLSDFLECGLVLTGTEIKSLRAGGGSLSDSYIVIRQQELYILNMHIAPFKHGTLFNHEPLRTRKLLAHRAQIYKLQKIVQEKGLTIVPTKVYLVSGRAKIEIAVGKGKKLYDKRETIQTRDVNRKLAKAIKGDLRD
jgi:SsrA-binding protein